MRKLAFRQNWSKLSPIRLVGSEVSVRQMKTAQATAPFFDVLIPMQDQDTSLDNVKLLGCYKKN